MPLNSPRLAPELQFRLAQVAQQLNRARAIRAWLRFGLATICVTAAATVFLVFADRIVFSPLLVIAVFFVSEIWLYVQFVFRPLRKPLAKRDVALYIDEHFPELQNRVVSAVEFTSKEHPEASQWLIERFLLESRDSIKPSTFAGLLDTRQAFKMIGVFALAALVPLAIVLFFQRAWIPSIAFDTGGRPQTTRIQDFEVEPGDVRVRKGDNQVVWVTSGKPNRKFTIRWRTPGEPWEAEVMTPGSDDTVFFKEFLNVQEDVEYEVSAGRLRSQEYTLTAWLPPQIESIDVAYDYPEYLDMARREVPNSGNVSAVEGTDVELNVWVNKKIKNAELKLESGLTLPLEEQSDALWTGNITVTQNDKYHVELLDHDGEPSEFNPIYSIVAQADNPPKIHISFPRDDIEVSMLDEVPFNFDIKDDFGLLDYGLQYQISGAEPVRVALNSRSGNLLEAKGTYELMLEDLSVLPSDIVTWTIWAEDRKPDRNEFDTMGDPYFLEVRKFKMAYSEAVSNQGGGGGGQAGGDALSEKDILVATWKLRKDAEKLSEATFFDNRSTIIEAQETLLNKFTQAATRATDNAEDVQKLMVAMAGAISHLKDAEPEDYRTPLSEAMVEEQKAYRLILKIQPPETQVQRNRGQGGGGGGGSQNRFDLDELEMDRNENFFEEERSTQQQEQAVEEALNKIKELAQRQKMVNEEIAKLISEIKKAQTEEERRELERRLERLQEEERRNLESLDQLEQQMAENGMDGQEAQDARQSLADARQQMNQSLENLEQGQLQRARSSGARALDTLDQLEQELQNLSGAAVAKRMKELQKEMERLMRKQEEAVAQAKDLNEEHQRPGLDSVGGMESRKEELLDTKDELTDEFVEFMERGSDLAERAAETQELASRKLGDWLRETSKEGILESMEEGRPLVEHGFWEAAVRQEEDALEKMRRAAGELDKVAEALVEDELDGMRKALAQLRELQTQDPNAEPQPGQGGVQRDLEYREGQPGAGEEQADAERQAGGPGEPSDEEQEARAGGQPGEPQEDEEAQQSRPGQPSEQGEPGQQQSEQGQPGQQPGQQQGQQQAQGGQPGQENQSSQPSSGGQRGGQDRPQAGSPQDRAGGSNRGGDPDGAWNGGWNWNMPRDRDDLRQFLERDADRWVNNLRDAESLLPEDSPYRAELGRIREEIEEMRRRQRRTHLIPRFDLFLKGVANPFELTAKALEEEIERILKEKEFFLADDGNVPPNYRKRVADFYKSLSEAEVAR